MEVAGTSTVSRVSRSTTHVPVGLLAAVAARCRRFSCSRAAPRADPARCAGLPLDAAGVLPLSFVPNRGQVDSRARASMPRGRAMRSASPQRGRVARPLARAHARARCGLGFVGAEPARLSHRREFAAGRQGELPARGRARQSYTDLPTFGELRYQSSGPASTWPFAATTARSSTSSTSRPAPNVRDIGLAYSGAQGLTHQRRRRPARAHRTRRAARQATRQLPGRERQARPRRASQLRRSTPASSGYGFVVGRHDPARPLVIDPGLVYSTYLGEQTFIETTDVDTDAQGNAYLAGHDHLVATPAPLPAPTTRPSTGARTLREQAQPVGHRHSSTRPSSAAPRVGDVIRSMTAATRSRWTAAGSAICSGPPTRQDFPHHRRRPTSIPPTTIERVLRRQAQSDRAARSTTPPLIVHPSVLRARLRHHRGLRLEAPTSP